LRRLGADCRADRERTLARLRHSADGGGRHAMTPTDEPFRYTANLAAIQFIAETGSPLLNISYY
jgi:hypothetical protein